MLRIQYINGEIPVRQFTEDGGVIAPNSDKWKVNLTYAKNRDML